MNGTWYDKENGKKIKVIQVLPYSKEVIISGGSIITYNELESKYTRERVNHEQ
jgi:ribosomal protein L24